MSSSDLESSEEDSDDLERDGKVKDGRDASMRQSMERRGGMEPAELIPIGRRGGNQPMLRGSEESPVQQVKKQAEDSKKAKGRELEE